MPSAPQCSSRPAACWTAPPFQTNFPHYTRRSRHGFNLIESILTNKTHHSFKLPLVNVIFIRITSDNLIVFNLWNRTRSLVHNSTNTGIGGNNLFPPNICLKMVFHFPTRFSFNGIKHKSIYNILFVMNNHHPNIARAF